MSVLFLDIDGVLNSGEWMEYGQAWPDAQATRRPNPTIAIVDDSDDMAHLAERLVRTTWARGLEDEHVERLIEMLGGPRG